MFPRKIDVKTLIHWPEAALDKVQTQWRKVSIICSILTEYLFLEACSLHSKHDSLRLSEKHYLNKILYFGFEFNESAYLNFDKYWDLDLIELLEQLTPTYTYTYIDKFSMTKLKK